MDRDGSLACPESNKPGTVPVYQRFGLVPTGKTEVARQPPLNRLSKRAIKTVRRDPFPASVRQRVRREIRQPERVIQLAYHQQTTVFCYAAGRPPSGQRPGEREVVARQPDGVALLRYDDNCAMPGAIGGIEATCLYAGQSAGLVRDILPAGELVRRIGAEAEATLARAGSMHRT